MIAPVRLTPADWRAYRDLRLAALAESPTAFGSRHADEARLDEARWRARLAEDRVTYAMTAGPQDWCALASGVPDEDGRPIVWVVSMWVAPDRRGLGLAAGLIELIADRAAESGAAELRLHVTSNNVAARRVYERVGFVATGQTLPHDHDPTLHEVEMSRPVVDPTA